MDDPIESIDSVCDCCDNLPSPPPEEWLYDSIDEPQFYNPYKQALFNFVLNTHGEKTAYDVIDQVDEEFYDSGLVKHARSEFKALGWKDEEEEVWLCEGLLDLLALFGAQGHSGATAPYTVELFNKLARYKIISPITGEDSEWVEVAEGVFQNRRCSHVFKEADGKAYDIEGKMFVEPDGCVYQSGDSRVYIDFPYTPKREYIHIDINNEQMADNAE